MKLLLLVALLGINELHDTHRMARASCLSPTWTSAHVFRENMAAFIHCVEALSCSLDVHSLLW